jgi:Integrase core domain.
VNELEVYAAIFGIKRYQAYLADSQFTLITDSRSLYWLEKNRDTKAKLTRWSLLLQEYNFEVQHCPGRENQLADFLSRNASEPHPVDMTDESRMLPPEPICQITHNELYTEVQNSQAHSRRTQRDILKWHRIHRNGPQNNIERKFHTSYTVRNNHLYKSQGEDNLLVVPKRKLRKVIHAYHDVLEEAHPGIDETHRKITQLYHAKGLRKQIVEYVNRCLPCHSVKSRQIQKEAPQKPHTAQSPFEVISIDVLGPYPVTPRDNKYVLIVEDLFTKWTEAKPASNSEAATICQFLEDEIFTRYGDPKVIISDNATVFQSQKYLNMCQRKQIQPYHTAIYFQRENPVERKVADFKTILRALMHNQQRRRNWDQQVPRALAIQRRRKNRATGESPATALLGYEAAAQGDWEIPEFKRRRKRPREDARLRRQTIIARQLNFQSKHLSRSRR